MRTLPVALLLTLVAIPAVSADHWDQDTGGADFGDSACYWYTLTDLQNPQCHVDYACTGGTPPQIVDTALYCSQRAAGEAADIAGSFPFYAWTVADWATAQAGSQLDAPHDALQPTVDVANEPLCNVVWSFFCSNPLSVPEDAPASDPVGEYPF